jgi:hypothetical protein
MDLQERQKHEDFSGNRTPGAIRSCPNCGSILEIFREPGEMMHKVDCSACGHIFWLDENGVTYCKFGTKEWDEYCMWLKMEIFAQKAQAGVRGESQYILPL